MIYTDPAFYMPVRRHEAEWIQRDPDTAEARAWGEWFASHIAAFGIGALLVSLIWLATYLKGF